MNTKRLLSLLLSTVFTLTMCAQNVVNFVSYEQDQSETSASISLKNNTETNISSLQFRIIYYNMQDNPISYNDFNETLNIAPGMTKSMEMDAYGWNKDYYYYCSHSYSNNAKAFKVKFQLLNYNGKAVTETEQEPEQADNVSETDVSENSIFDHMPREEKYMLGIPFIIFIVATVVSFGIYFGFYILVAIMASKRQRSLLGWILISVLITPVFSAILLLILGDADKES